MITLSPPLSEKDLLQLLPTNRKHLMKQGTRMSLEGFLPRKPEKKSFPWALSQGWEYDRIARQLQNELSTYLRELQNCERSPHDRTSLEDGFHFSLIFAAILAGANHAIAKVVTSILPRWSLEENKFNELWKTLNYVAFKFEIEALPRGPDYLETREDSFLRHVNGSVLEWARRAKFIIHEVSITQNSVELIQLSPQWKGSNPSEIAKREIIAVYGTSLSRAARLALTRPELLKLPFDS